jgi:hypothetical protein
VNADKNITVKGSDITTNNGDINLNAKENVNLLASENEYRTSHNKKESE